MTRRRALFAVVAGMLLISLLAWGQQISTSEAKNHIGENATVCGSVVSTRYAASARGAPTFLNLDKPYPDQVFTIVIWGSDRGKFGNPEESFRNKRVCVSGQISNFRGVPEIVAKAPGQIKLQ